MEDNRGQVRLRSERRIGRRASVYRRSFAGAVALIALIGAVALAAPPAALAISPKVIIDAGHGGSAPGAVANGVVEKSVNLDIALRLAHNLVSAGYRVELTRSTDRTTSLAERSNTANDLIPGDIFVSIHNNWSYAKAAHGAESYYHGNSAQGRALAGKLLKGLVQKTGQTNRGARSDFTLYTSGIYVLRHANMAAALVEGAFLSNPTEARRLKSAAFREKIADGLVNGVKGYFDMRTYGASFLSDNTPTAFAAGNTYRIPVVLANTGNLVWGTSGSSEVRLAYWWKDLKTGRKWYADAADLPGAVPYGDQVTLSARVKAPAKPGRYLLGWDMRHVGTAWFSSRRVARLYRNVNVTFDYHAEYPGDARDHTPDEMYANTTTDATVVVKNTSTVTWPENGPVGLDYRWIDSAGNAAFAGYQFNQRVYPDHDVGPGETHLFRMRVKGPPRAGTWKLRYDMALTGVAWFSQKGVGTLDRTVQGRYDYDASYLSHDTPGTMLAGRTTTATVRVKNTSRMTWPGPRPLVGDHKIALDYKWVKGGRVVAVGGQWGLRKVPASAVLPGETYTFKVKVRAPSTIGQYTLVWDMYQSGVTWFSAKGAATKSVSVNVQTGMRASIASTGEGYNVYLGDSDATTMPAGNKTTVIYNGGTYYVSGTKEDGRGWERTSTKPVRFVPFSGSLLKVASMSDLNIFRGTLEVRYSPAHRYSRIDQNIPGYLWAINVVKMQQYLKGVAEEPDDFPTEAFKAGIIAFRTYAWACKLAGKYKEEPFDISSSTGYTHYDGDDQWYIGYKRETHAGGPTPPNRMSNLVEKTEGRVVTYGGKVARTPYFGHCDGRTRNGPYPWLRSKKDGMCVGRTLTAHGLGMCMYGAKWRDVNRNWTAGQILRYYYTGIDVVNKIGDPTLRVGVYSVK